MIQPLQPWCGLRDRSDVLSVVVLLSGLSCLILGWSGHLPFWAWPATPVLVYLAYLINHNHLHVTIWRAPRQQLANRTTGVLLSVVMGFPAAVIAPLHLANHHHVNNREADYMWTGIITAGRPGWWGLLIYPLAAARRYRRHRIAAHADYARAHPSWHTEVRTQRLILMLVVVLAVLVDPLATLLWLVLPWVLGQAWVINANYIQHHGCDPTDPQAHCRCITGWINRLIFNGGWHFAHHTHPNIHWSRLPSLGLSSRHASSSLLLLLWRLAHART